MNLDEERPKVMTVEAAEKIRHRACIRKSAYGMHHAKGYAQTLCDSNPGANYTAYRCPFCERWHVGRLMSFEAMQSMAMAIRVLAQQ